MDAPKVTGLRVAGRQFTAGLVFGCIVTVQEGAERYGDDGGDALLDGRVLNRELVANGFAWHKRYSSDLGLARLEETARAQKRGLWVDAHPVAPWGFRRLETQKNQRAAIRRYLERRF